jgi:uncharacterized membrane protein
VSFSDTVETVGKAVDGVGVGVTVVGIAAATALLVRSARRSPRVPDDLYRGYRQGVGRAILLGLEFLVAGDIIRTVAVSPTFRSAGVLALIVLIRTFLSMALELELQGRWPWQGRAGPAGESAHAPH